MKLYISELEALGHRPEPVLRAIRRKCLDCSGGSAAEVADCLVRNCALYPFRLGTNPWRPPVSEARRRSAREAVARLQKAGTIPPSGATGEAAGTSLPADPDSNDRRERRAAP